MNMNSMATPPSFRLSARHGAKLAFHSPEGHAAYLFVLDHDLIRVMVLPGGVLRHPNTWAIAPGADDVPTAGRDRFDLSGFAKPDYAFEETPETVVITTGRLRLTVTLKGFFCRWESRVGGQWQHAAADRATQAHNFGWWDDRVRHYLQRSRDEMYFGLGERAGDTDRHGSRYSMINVDAMGYSARSSDPLYKHIPFYLTWKRETRVPFGLFYDTLADCHFDMGRELDNYHGHYRYFCAEDGDLDYWFVGGETLADVVTRFTWLTGRPALMPKWGLGYSGSTMTYTDAPNAQERMNEFLAGCAGHDILCDSFHLSSGYTSIGNKRYVFNWDRSKFPDPQGFVAHYLAHGVRLVPNIKPCLLRDHPQFEDAARRGLFIKAEDGTPEMVQFWDEVGAYLDFTNPETLDWWRAQVKSALLEYGMAATWNDNNEFEIWNPRAICHNFGAPRPAAQAKPLHTLLMMQASKAAQVEHDPQRRPFLVSRSGCAGMQRYVQTWSGDNYTSWETLRYNIRMAIGLALSGVSNTGHDIGGFAGPAPEPELFLRWVQANVLMPRFSIHSWNDDKTVNEPWMYPHITPAIRDLIRLRYRYLPSLYHLLWRSHCAYEPVIRPAFLTFPEDDACFAEHDDMMIGPDLLVAPVVEPGVEQRSVYLPKGCGWYDVRDGRHFGGGQHAVLGAALEGLPPALAREGAVLALNLAEQHFGQSADVRGFAIYPPRGNGVIDATCFDDDGDQSIALSTNDQHLWHIGLTASGEALELAIRAPEAKPASEVTVLLPACESRAVRCGQWDIVGERRTDCERTLRLVARG
jgi:alpha-glucosidase